MPTHFVIVGAPRTGSTLLVKTLNSIAGIRCHGELLGEDQVRGFEDGVDLVSISQKEREERVQRLLLARNSDPTGFIRRAIDTGGTATGFKALYNAFLNPRWHEVVSSLCRAGNTRFIHLKRTNSLRRFVSEQVLLQGGPNHSGAGGRSETPIKVEIDIDMFLNRDSELEAQAAQLEKLLSDQQVLEISYEALSAETASTVGHVCEFLGVDVDPSEIKPALSKVGATDLKNTVSNYQQLLQHPATRVLAISD
jgi:LPS sulfotransferase NodH